MKGLLVSLAVFLLYVISVAIYAHVFRQERFSRLFFSAFAVWTPAYFIAYYLTPEDLYFLSKPWIAKPGWLDVSYGYAVLCLNFHSFIDFFFAVNGGFSMCLMRELLRVDACGLSTSEILEMFHQAGDMNKIYGWRLPRLVETGYVRQDRTTSKYVLTMKGIWAAKVVLYLNRILSLSKGG